MRIKYAEGDNYNFGATQYVSFTVKKESVLTIKNIIGPDGNPIAGIADSTLGIKFGEDFINDLAEKKDFCDDMSIIVAEAVATNSTIILMHGNISLTTLFQVR